MLPDDAARAADKVKTAHQVHAGAAEHENARRGRQVELRWGCVRAPRWKSQPPAGAAYGHRSIGPSPGRRLLDGKARLSACASNSFGTTRGTKSETFKNARVPLPNVRAH